MYVYIYIYIHTYLHMFIHISVTLAATKGFLHRLLEVTGTKTSSDADGSCNIRLMIEILHDFTSQGIHVCK